MLRETAGHLAAAGHQVAHLADAYDGFPTDYPLPIYPWRQDTTQGIAPGGPGLFARALDHFEPDAVVLAGDIWQMQFLPEWRANTERDLRLPRPQVVLWLTVDSCPLPAGSERQRILEAADKLAVTTAFGQRVLAGEVTVPLASAAPTHYASALVELGVDPAIYHPGVRQEARALLPPDADDGRYRLGWVGLNQMRKHPEVALVALAELKRRNEPVCLLMKIHAVDAAQGIDLLHVCGHLGLRQTTRSWLETDAADVYWILDNRLTEQDMARLYGLFDIYCHTASAGAPELPLLEARACGLPTVAVATSCFPDYADYLAAPRGWQFSITGPVLELPDPLTVADAVQAARSGGPRGRAVPTWEDTARELLAVLAAPVPEWLGGRLI